MELMLDAPLIYFGGKGKVASEIWRALGDVNNYVEAFMGSAATLLARPPGWTGTETVNDKDSLVSNFWRALKHDPDGVAQWADNPVNESDKHARQLWIVNQLPHLADLQAGDPDHYDVKIAGYWVWGINAHIGGGFCDGKGPWKQDLTTGKLAKIDDDRPGINRAIPHPGSGSGVNRQVVLKSEGGLLQWMRDLSNRLRYVVVTTGDWSRIMGPSFIPPQCISGVMLDPPYSADSGRGGAVYREDDQSLAHVVRRWAIDNGDNPRIRIALCGYAGEHPMPTGWTEFRWKAVGGYGNQGDGIGRANAEREVIWFSSHCLKSGRQVGLFDDPDPIVVSTAVQETAPVTPPTDATATPQRAGVPEIDFDGFAPVPVAVPAPVVAPLPLVAPVVAPVPPPPAAPALSFDEFDVAPVVPPVAPTAVPPSIPDIDFETFQPSVPSPTVAPPVSLPFEMPWVTAPSPTIAPTGEQSPRTVSVAPPLLFMGASPSPKWVALEPPDITHLDTIVLNFETSGLKWWDGDRPVGVTVGSLDGKLKRYLPFGHVGGGNLDEGAVIRWLRTIRGKHILNANTRFDLHMGRVIDVDFEAQGCTVSDIQHTAALLSDHRKEFKLDVLMRDYCPDVPTVPRVDESRMASYHASEVAQRAEFQVEAVAKLRAVMYPEIEAQDLRRVHDLEDQVIYPLVEMEKNGALLDLELLEVYYQECTRRHQQRLWEVSKECGFAFDGKPQQWQRLFEKFGLPVTLLDTGKPTFTDDLLARIDHPVVQRARQAAQYASLNSKTFAAYRERVDSNGVLRFDLNQLRGDEGGTVCLPAGELVLTDRGYLPTELVPVGAQVIGHTGKPRRVVATINNGVQPIVKTTLSNGLTLRTTPNHQYLTRDGWVEACLLKPGDSVCIHSDPEQWRDIPEWPDFEISSWGRIFNRETKHFIKQWGRDPDYRNYGRLRVDLHRNGAQTRQDGDIKSFSVHTLVANAFLGRSTGLEVRHLNGIAWDNTVDNLAWGSSQNNSDDAVAHGTTSKRGGSQAKLTPEAVRFIRSNPIATRDGGITNKQLTEMFGVGERLIRWVRSGDRWPDRPPVVEKAAKFRYANVLSIEWQSPEMTYGLSVEEDHSHVTGGIVTHNSGRFSCGIVQQVPNHDNHFEAFGDDLFPRDLFISATGTVIAVDAAQIEQRVLASLAKNPKTIAAYAADPMLSFHKMVHAMLLPYKPDLSYSHLKSLNFLRIYGGGLIKIAVMMGYITEAEGEQIRRDKTQKTDPRLAVPREIEAIYARVLPEVGPLTRTATHLAMSKCNSFCKPDDELHKKCKHRGYVKTVLGRRSRFPNDYKVYRALNRIIQGGSADCLKLKAVELHRERKTTGFLMRTTIHDEFVGDAATPETLSLVLEILNRQSFPEFKIPIMWTGKASTNWSGCK